MSSSRRTGMQPVQDLPDECWALILSRLKSKVDRDAAALTCRRWRSLEALSRRSLRFQRPNVSEEQWPRIHLLVLQALHSFPNILSLTIDGGLYDLCYSFPRVFQHKGFARLTSFDLFIRKDQMNDHLLQCLALGCPSLTNLFLFSSYITDAGMFSLAHGCPLLRVLDMSRCSITDKGIDVLLSKCVDMREFSVEECNIKGWGFRHGKRLEKLMATDCYITDAGLVEVLQGATCLRMLDLSYNRGRPRLSSIGECCRELESLNLTSSVTLDDVALETIAEGCTNLRVLDVSWCDYVTPEGWEVLAHSCKKLEELAVTGCEGFNPDCLLDIEDGCPNLRALKVSDRFAVHSSLARFRVSRPAVDVQFYNIDNHLTY